VNRITIIGSQSDVHSQTTDETGATASGGALGDQWGGIGSISRAVGNVGVNLGVNEPSRAVATGLW
jgi:hypothetical protein